MSTDKRKVVPSLAKTIDSVLDTPPAKPQIPVRPLAKLRPSWIGPSRQERAETPGVEIMKQHVNVEFALPGLQPPVYIFTNLSSPQWEAVETQAEKTSDGEYRFSRPFEVEEGEYQYKFRLGSGDWWACDESRPTVDDGMGNKNNLLIVKTELLKAEPVKIQPRTEEPPKESRPDSAMSTPPIKQQTPAMLMAQYTPQGPPITIADSHEKLPLAPLMKHETFAPKGAQSQQTPEREVADPFLHDDDLDADVPLGPLAPLLPHETFPPWPKTNDEYDEEGGDEDSTTKNDDHDSASTSDTDDYAEYAERAPLFRHESLSPHDVPSITDRNAVYPTSSGPVILAAPGSPGSQVVRSSSASPPSLGRIVEDEEDDTDEEELEKIRKAGEEEVEREEANGEEADP